MSISRSTKTKRTNRGNKCSAPVWLSAKGEQPYRWWYHFPCCRLVPFEPHPKSSAAQGAQPVHGTSPASNPANETSIVTQSAARKSRLLDKCEAVRFRATLALFGRKSGERIHRAESEAFGCKSDHTPLRQLAQSLVDNAVLTPRWRSSSLIARRAIRFLPASPSRLLPSRQYHRHAHRLRASHRPIRGQSLALLCYHAPQIARKDRIASQ